ncbi:bacillithiol system redox-active protein YtxJ [Flavobacterium sp.]|uniref:bacillithiol system redox-active protein YtxJ n=1 Tax=Flavobacterium sp. TaxID=239 RepID=UPI003753ABEE
MSLFKNIFGGSEEEPKTSKLNWNPLTDLGQLNEISELSNTKAVAIFKHSTRCSISRMALKQFENEFLLDDKITLYFLDLLNYRAISNEISSRFDVEHQSPQLIVIKNGNAIYNVSHGDIDANDLERYL